ncbi:MAG: hypothetical protein BWY85_00071 [Firmicutes bacterium ADurb.Bin506]|nr:MAG: hypothetical protein BWY85_00071 [Firmicutes bacterium ADurb.Bin506]
MRTPINVNPAAVAAYNDTIALGRQLVERGEKDGGWAEYFDADNGLGMEDEVKAAHTAVMLENARRWLGSLDESTLALTVGGFRDFIFPIIRASFPNNPINEIVSVQPQTRKNGTIYWMNYIIGQTRGQFLRGQTLFDANNGWQGRVGYTDEKVSGEAMTPTGASATQTGTLSELPVRANTVEITITTAGGTAVLRDNGNGGLVAVSNSTAEALTSGTINYQTGAFSAVFAGAITSTAVSADYESNAEGQYVRSQIDLEIQSAGTVALRRAIAMRISMESMQDFQAEFGQDISQQIVTAASQQILADVGGEVVRDLWDMAGTPVATFDLKVPLGVNRAEHYRDINWEIQQASGAITEATQRGEATFGIVDQNAANILITAGAAAGFTKAANTYKGQGLVYIGDYNGLKMYKYKFMSTFPGASSFGNMLLGYKGEDWWDTGYVHAPYQQFYTNGPDERADLTRRQAFAMRYAKKRINANMYKRVGITSTAATP